MASNAGISDRWALVDLSGERSGGASLIVKVNGMEGIPISQFAMTSGLNAVPTATAMIAVGRDARTGNVSLINTIVTQIQQMAPVEVLLRGKLGDWSTDGGPAGKKQWPGGEHVLFCGYTAGISYRRALGRVYIVMNMVSQLVDLSMSSCGSTDLVPGAPQSLVLPTLVRGTGANAYADVGSKFVEQLPLDMVNDLSKGLLRSMEIVSTENQIQTAKLWCKGNSQVDDTASNVRALQALSGTGKWKGMNNLAGTDEYTSAYPLKIHSAGTSHVARSIGTIIGQSLAGTSMWSMLIGSLLPHFGMGIVPLSDRAYMVPILPMAREAYTVITPNEYVDFDQKAMAQRPLFGVGVSSFHNMATLPKGEDPKVCVGASFTAKSVVTKDGKPDGMWMIVESPFWLEGWVHTDPFASVGGGGSAVEAALSKPSHSVDGSPPSAEQSLNRDVGSEVADWNNVIGDYARMVYASNALRGRDGTVTGKLRFDISPGSTVKIAGKGEKFSDGTDQLATDMYGFVARTTTIIDAEQSSACTTYELTNLRTDVENKSDRFSMSTHPFFDSYFKGSPLVSTLRVR